MAVLRRDGKLYIDFFCPLPDGTKRRTKEATGLVDTKGNYRHCQQIEQGIQGDIKLGRFDYLDRFPQGNLKKYFEQPKAELITINELWGRYTATLNNKATTMRQVLSAYNNHVKPVFGAKLVSHITAEDLLTYRKTLQDKGYSPRTINDRYFKLIGQLLRYAHKMDYIDSNPLSKLDSAKLKTTKKDILPYHLDEIDKLYQAARHNHKWLAELVYTWVRCGFRPGELCALKWANINFDARTIHVAATRNNDHTETSPKTDSSDRVIKMSDEVYHSLKRQELLTRLRGGYIFLSRRNTPFISATLLVALRSLHKVAGVKFRSPVQFRHTFATLHIQGGAKIAWVSRTLGHTNITMTLDTYTRYVDNLFDDGGGLALDTLTAQAKAQTKIQQV